MTKMERVAPINPPSRKSVWKFVGFVTVVFIVICSMGSMFRGNKDELSVEKALVVTEPVPMSEIAKKVTPTMPLPTKTHPTNGSVAKNVTVISSPQKLRSDGVSHNASTAIALASQRTILAFGDSLTYGNTRT